MTFFGGIMSIFGICFRRMRDFVAGGVLSVENGGCFEAGDFFVKIF